MSNKDPRLFEIPQEPYLKKGKRHTMDTYITPMPVARWSIKHAYELVKDNRNYTSSDPLVVLELCAGPAPFARAARAYLNKIGVPHAIDGLELNPAFPPPLAVDEWWVMDATEELPVKADIILINPPFALVEPILRRAIEALRPGGHIICLLPAHFEFAKGRDQFFEKHAYKERWVLSRRPGFYYALLNNNPRYARKTKTGKTVLPSGKGTDNMHYCMFVFDKEERTHQDRLFWEYDDDDPLHREMQESHSMAVYALIYEAAKADEGELVWDDMMSMMAARFFGWKFVDATPEERMGMRSLVKEAISLHHITLKGVPSGKKV